MLRDAGKGKMGGKMGEVGIKEKVGKIDEEVMMKGYIVASGKREDRLLKRDVGEKKMDLEGYERVVK